MSRNRSALVLASLLLTVGCVPPSYTTKLPQNRERWQPSTVLTNNVVLSGLAKQLAITSQQCGNVREQLDIELDGRQHALSQRRMLFAGASGACGTAVGIYSGVATLPDKRIITVLSACAGGTIVAAIPALLTDDRLAVLTTRLTDISAKEAPVIADWGALELAAAKGQDVTTLAATFRTDLIALGEACQ